MNKAKKELIYALACIVVLIMALVYVFAGTRVDAPVVDEMQFTLPVTYEQDGKSVTVSEKYGCYYIGDGQWQGYFVDTGDKQCAYIEEKNGDVWTLDVEVEAGYLMGDDDYADIYKDGMPSPTITYLNVETGEEQSGLTEIKEHGVKVIGCKYPEAIENEYIDAGVSIDGRSAIVLAAMAALLLLLAVVLFRKKDDVVYGGADRLSAVFNFVVGLLGVPLITLVCYERSYTVDAGIGDMLLNLLPAATVLGICASVILRRKGRPQASIYVQFIAPAIGVMLIALLAFSGMLPHSISYVLGIAAGVLLAVFSKKGEDVVEESVDRVTRTLNILLIPVYGVLSALPVFMAAITEPSMDASLIQEILTIIIVIFVAGAPLYCGISLGLSVAFRKKGKGKAAFAVQFAGLACLVLTIIVILLTDFIPWINASIN